MEMTMNTAHPSPTVLENQMEPPVNQQEYAEVFIVLKKVQSVWMKSVAEVEFLRQHNLLVNYMMMMMNYLVNVD